MNQEPAKAQKPSAVEIAKLQSRYLRGQLAEELQQNTDHFSDSDKQLLKFHGSYQQEDRDARKNRRKEGLGKYYMFMVRCKIPGGRLTAAQYLAMDDIAGEFANSTLRITTRQSFQLHGILKGELKASIQKINNCFLTTLGACGDANRNVMICPNPRVGVGLHAQLFDLGQKLADQFAPKGGAYHEIWLNGQPVFANAPEEPAEPLYGKVYLPRKFKIGIALPENNLIDIYAQDLGLLALTQKDHIEGYNVLVGGGMGMTHGNALTFPHLAQPICYVPVEKAVPIAEAVLKLFRDHGNRENRKRVRIKYLVHDWGVEKFRSVLAGYVDFPLEDPRPTPPLGFDLLLGWQAQGDGKYWYGISVENGRIKDEGEFRLRSALRAILARFPATIRLTPAQDLLLCDLPESARGEIESLLGQHGIPLPLRLSLVQQHSMACPAIPTCGLAISEAERALPQLIDQLETEIDRLQLPGEKISVRMTGCPNGCARPYQSDIGIVGRSGDKYALFVGGNLTGTRLNYLLQDLVPLGEMVPLLVPLFQEFKAHRLGEESFGDFCHRLGLARVYALLPENLRKPLPKGESPKD